MYQYLHSLSYYHDLYDLHTIETCLDYYWSLKKKAEKHRTKSNDLTPEQFDKEIHKGVSYIINVIKGERYRHRADTIKKWIDRDRKIQDIFDNANIPVDVLCKECNSPTINTIKDLHDAYSDNPKVLFMFECIRCKKRRAVYEDGKEWTHEPEKCPKCNGPLECTMKNKKRVLTTINKCTKCSYINKEIDDFDQWDKKQKEKADHDNKLLSEYRKEFCLDDVDGPSYLRSLDGMYQLAKELKEREDKEKDPIYQKAMQLKKINIIDMEKLIIDAITPQKYIRFTLGQPTMSRYVEVSFTAQDIDNIRQGYDSSNTLKKLIIKVLDGTNWRLKSDGITEKLGVLSGHLKGIEQEADLIALVSKH